MMNASKLTYDLCTIRIKWLVNCQATQAQPRRLPNMFNRSLTQVRVKANHVSMNLHASCLYQDLNYHDLS